MAQVPKPWLDAASLIVLAQNCHSSEDSNYSSQLSPGLHMDNYPTSDFNCLENVETNFEVNTNFEILLLKRNPKSNFAATASVFPGGAADAYDFDIRWAVLFKNIAGQTLDEIRNDFKITGPRPNILTVANSDGIHPEIALRICAIRETFEESGILLVRQASDFNGDADHVRKSKFKRIELDANLFISELILAEWRKLIHISANNFILFCEKFRLLPDVWALYEWSNWLTPPLNHQSKPTLHKKRKRFDTMFYICFLHEIPQNVSVDNNEVISKQWATPFTFLDLNSKSQLVLMLPQQYELSRLINFHQLAEVENFALKRQTQGVQCWMSCNVQSETGVAAILPGDELYPNNPDFVGSQHQVTLNSDDDIVGLGGTAIQKSDRIAVFDIDSALRDGRQINRCYYNLAEGPLIHPVCTALSTCGHLPPRYIKGTFNFAKHRL